MAVLLSSGSSAQNLAGAGPPTPLLESMVGRWDVTQKMWTGPDTEPVALPDAVAVRVMAAGGGFIDEQMSAAKPSKEPFTRTSHINYNAIDGVFEYFSIDTRAPQQMHYQSQAVPANSLNALSFKGGTFVAGQWGDKKNVAFAYRVELSAIAGDRQDLRLHLRPLEAGAPREFVAFYYEYRRRR